MKSLTTLIKLQKTRVDEQRAHLTKLQKRLADINRQITELEIEKAREQVAAQENPEARLTYGAFIANAIKRGEALENERQTAAFAVDLAHERLTELFEEQKRYEIAEEARIEAEAAEERRLERITLDEVGSVRFARKQKEQKD